MCLAVCLDFFSCLLHTLVCTLIQRAQSLSKNYRQFSSVSSSEPNTMEHTNSATSMDEQIKRTFDMLMERISNLEEIAQTQTRGAIFAECCKYGYLNNETLGYPFTIMRKPRSREAPPTPYCTIFVVDITTSCECSIVLRTAAGVRTEGYWSSPLEGRRPSSLGWMESRFRLGHEEAVQRCIDAFFKESMFEIRLLEQEDDHTIKVSIGLKQPRCIRIDEFLTQIPLICKALGHANSKCINVIFIRDTNVRCIDLVLAIQNAANLPAGSLKEQWVQKRDAFVHEEWCLLAKEEALYNIIDVRAHRMRR